MDLSSHTSLAPLAEAIQEIYSAAVAEGLEIYLAGALARDLWLVFRFGIDTGRRTSDVDFAVQCRDWATFDRLREILIARGEVTCVRKSLHKFRHRNGTELDILPYGGVEGPDRLIAWPPDGASAINGLGFTEVASTVVSVILPGGTRIPVVPLSSLALLKIIAWDDRRNRSEGKDAQDLFLIARTYLDAGNRERLYEEGSDLLEQPDFDYEAAGAELLGRDVAALCEGALKTSLGEILRRETDPLGSQRMAYQMTRDETEGLRILEALRRGFER
jgi:predicted nucleotidyltransferase